MSLPQSFDHKIDWPFIGNDRVVLLHCCCAVCSGAIIEAMLHSQISPVIFFFNPNIDPLDEYQRRKEDVLSFARKQNLKIIDADYRPQDWFARIKGLEGEPEGGERCRQCFELRLEASAKMAFEQRIHVFTSTLGISRYKNFELINFCGKKAAQGYPDLKYWDHNWRKKGGSQRMYTLARQEEFYAQDYCGCRPSLIQNVEFKSQNLDLNMQRISDA